MNISKHNVFMASMIYAFCTQHVKRGKRNCTTTDHNDKDIHTSCVCTYGCMYIKVCQGKYAYITRYDRRFLVIICLKICIYQQKFHHTTIKQVFYAFDYANYLPPNKKESLAKYSLYILILIWSIFEVSEFTMTSILKCL